MFGIKVFGIQKPRGFGYKPRYWDQEKEEREERRRQVLGDKYQEGGENYQPGSLIREGRLRRMQSSQKVQGKSKTTLIRGLLFLGMVFVLLYLMTNYIGKVSLF